MISLIITPKPSPLKDEPIIGGVTGGRWQDDKKMEERQIHD